MVVILKICAVGITGLIIISIIKAYKPEFTVEAVLCTSIILLWFALEGLQQAFVYMGKPIRQAHLRKGVFSRDIKGSCHRLRHRVHFGAV